MSVILFSNSATPPTPASGKTAVFINSNKKPAYVNDSGTVNAIGVPVTSTSSPSDPTGTTSTTGVMMGLAGTITPKVSGKILIVITGIIFNNTASDGASVQLRYGTGTAPTNGAALTGTTLGSLKSTTYPASNMGKQGFMLNATVSSLTSGTAYWIDVGVAAITGGTASIQDVDIVALEI